MGIKPQTFLTMEEVAAIRKCESDGFSECLEFFTVRLSSFLISSTDGTSGRIVTVCEMHEVTA